MLLPGEPGCEDMKNIAHLVKTFFVTVWFSQALIKLHLFLQNKFPAPFTVLASHFNSL
jgi:hypothetical protein